MAGKYADNHTSGSGKGLPKYLMVLLIIMSVLLVGSIVFVLIGMQYRNSHLPADSSQQSSSDFKEDDNSQDANGNDNQDENQNDEPQIPADALSLIDEADFIAAGYDYEKAIAMLEDSPYDATVPEMAEKVTSYKDLQSKLVVYDSPSTVTHIFFHSLIVDTDRAFDNDGDGGGYNMYMATVDEFWAIMEEMYERGFVLISPYDLAYEGEDGKFTYGEILLPEGKTPFLMSQDDVNYYSYMIGTGDGKNETPIFADTNGDGFAHKIVIGEDGYPTCEYMDKDGNILVGDYDLVPLLEKFIQQHPDFSYRGARAMLGVTGYEGVFGYRTKPSYEAAMGSEAYAAEVQAAKDVAQCLKDHGWLIVSHSYGHPPYGEIDYVDYDSNKWEQTVQPIVGETDIILYPHGSDIHIWKPYPKDNYKFKVLYEDGYRYFFNVDGSQYWNQLGELYFRGGRRNIDGIRMYYNPEMLDDLFDVAEVFDPARPTPVPNSGWGM